MIKAKLGVLAAALFVFAASVATAQDYPTRPITIIVPFPAGGPTDVLARLLANAMGANLKQQLIVETVGGAGGTIGAARAARAPADGYTILLNNSSHSSAPALYAKLPYDPVADFEPVGLVADVPQTVVAKAGFPANDLKELIAHVKANKDKINLANAGRGSASHLCGMLFTSAIETPLTTVVYQGTGPAMNDMLGGQVDVMCDQVTNTSAQIKAGKVKVYCVTTKTRVSTLPDVPPCAEAGLPHFEASVWHGLYAPKGTPKPMLERLNEALRSALRDETVKQRLAELGTQPVPQKDVSPDALRQHLISQVAKWSSVIKQAGLAPE
jgi:tripartite-type tricarboxylate transporter receptor subunit TctC